MSIPSSRVDPEERLGDAIAEYLRAAESGRPLDRSEFLSRYPDLHPELSTFIANHDEASRMSQPLRDQVGSGDGGWPRPTFGPYEIRGEIGRGGMGVIYRAWQPGLNRSVALKMIRSGWGATEDDIERFQTEAEAAASLSHPNIVSIYEFGRIDDQHYYTMELIEGETIDRLDRDFFSHPREAATLLALVARAVHHAHQRGIIHRDLKPSNILVDEAGQPHITDFGLAIRAESGERRTESNVFLGTLPYMAPEQLSGKKQPLTTAVDIWSLGVILYELLTGKRPFQGKNQIDTIETIRSHSPASIRGQNFRVPGDLEAIVLKCLEKEPEHRFGSILDLATNLEGWLNGEPIRIGSVHPVVSAWWWCRRNPARAGLIAGAALFLVCAILGSAFYWAQQNAQRMGVLKGLVYTARFVADVVRTRFEEWGKAVDRTAQDPELPGIMEKWNQAIRELPNPADVRSLLNGANQQEIQKVCERLHRASQGGPAYEDWFILDERGTLVARTPTPVNLGGNFENREYFRGMAAHVAAGAGGTAHVSAAFLASVDGHAKFVVCRPIQDKGRFLGMVAMAMGTHRTMGLNNLQDDDRNVALIAPWDPSRRANDPEMIWPTAPRYVLFLHPGYKNPSENPVAIELPELPAEGMRKCPEDLLASDSGKARGIADYADPFAAKDPAYAGHWLAGMAPVGNTGFLVLVQQRDR
jgi:serine/threonine-protein kinase